MGTDNLDQFSASFCWHSSRKPIYYCLYNGTANKEAGQIGKKIGARGRLVTQTINS